MKRFPLSKTEYGMYLEQVSKENTAYNLPLKIELGSEVDIDRLCGAIKTAVNAHPCLKSAFAADKNGETYKYLRDCGVDVEIIEADDFDLYSLVKPFDLQNDILYRFYIIKSSSGNTLFFDIHHIVFDGTSCRILAEQISRAYFGEEIEPEEFTANDYALEEAQLRKSEEYEKAKVYFEETFGGADVNSALFTDKNDREPVAKEIIYPLTNVDSKQIKAFSRLYGIRRSTVFNGAFAYVLSQYSGSEQALFSTYRHGRDERMSDTVGAFVKTYPVYADFSEDEPVVEFLQKLDEHISLNRNNDLYSFADFREDMKLDASVLFAYQGDIIPPMDFCGCESEIVLMPMKDTKAAFELTVRRRDGRFVAYTLYQQNLYDDEIIRGLLESYNKVLSEMLGKEKLSEIEMLTDAQLEKLDRENHFEFDYEITDIVTMFRRQAEKTPDNIAVVYLDHRYTYKEIDRITENIAAFLKSKGVGKNNAVSVLIPRCEYMPIAAIGIHKSGAGYQPLDPSYPSERLEFMIKDADAKYLVADRELMDKIPSYNGPVLYTDEIPSLPDAEKISENPDPGDLFIMLYTSGSTGVPKGVMLEHHNLCCFCNWYINTYKMDETSRASAYASYGFDCHMLDMYPVLLVGGQLHIIDESIRLDLVEINKYFTENKITHTFMTTQVGRQYAELFPDAENPHHLSAAGEKLVPVEPPRGFKLYNGYGPTECTIFTHMHPVDKLYDRVPIGKPLFNMKQYVVDKQLRRVPFGVPGELIVAGHQVGRGYLNRPEKNAEVFIKNPFSDEEGYEHAYRTGDIVRIMSDGNVDFIGRNDGQVKIRGFRIELSEVEGVIRKFPGIKDATVQAFDEPGGGKYIAAYVVSDEPVDVEAMGEFIKQDKPAYMVPAVTMQIDRIPLNQNQKVNRRALPKPEPKAKAEKKDQPAAPLNVLEKEIQSIVAEVIGTSDFGVTDPFVDFGLTSISSIKLAMLIYERFGVQINVRGLVSDGNIQSIENEILAGFLKNKEDAPAAEETRGAQTCRLSFAQQGVYAECQASPDSVRYNLPFVMTFPEGIGEKQLADAVRKVIDAHSYVLCRFVADSDNEIVQEPIPDCVLDIPVKEMTGDEFEKYKSTFVKPFDLAAGPCVRLEIIKTDTLNLLVDMHHLVSDGASMDLFFERLCETLDGKEPEPERYTYYDFAAQEKITSETEDFFAQKMAEVEEPTQLIPDVFTENLPHTENSVSVKTEIKAVKEFAQKNGVTPAAVYLAACFMTFGRFVCEDTVSIITISNGRGNVKVGNTFGMFVNTLPLVTTLDHKEKTADFLRRVSQNFSDTIDHESYPFARIASKYDFHPSISYAYQIGVINDYKTKFGSVSAKELGSDIAKVPISIFIDGTEDDANIIVTYDTALYSGEMMRGLADSIQNAAQGLMECDSVSEISLTNEKQWQVLDSYNKPWDLDYDMTDSVATRFKKIVAQYPDKTAAVFKDKSYTYKELDELTDSLAAKIYKIACEVTGKTDLKEEVAAIILPRNEQTFILPMAAVKAGMGYEPLDPSYPQERLNFMVKDADVCMLIADDELRDVVDEFKGKVVTVGELYGMETPKVTPIAATPDSLFIMLYTSGSTGMPKGCQIENGNIVAYAHGMRNTFYTKDDNVAAYASFSFDVNMADVFCTLLVGGTVHIVPEEVRMNLDDLAAYFDEVGITTLLLTTQVGVQFLQNYPKLKTLRLLVMGGEKLPAVEPSGISYTIANGYGPTENCCGVSIFPIKEWEPNIPIGKPIATIHGYVLDKTNHRLPAGAAGEYCLSGPQVSRGYLNRPDKTAEAYEASPFDRFRMYHTGDIVRYRQSGDIEFVGRKDGQVKIRGFRIETKEVEAVIRGYEGIRDVTVQAYDYEGGGKYLAAFVVGKGTVDTTALAEYIKSQKPAYMCPAVIMQIDKIPLTVNQKVDKKALPKPEQKKADYVAPANKTEEDFCAIFRKVLDVERVSAEDDFFDIGGSSILAMKVVIAAEKAGYKIVYNDVFSYTTPRLMAEFLGDTTRKPVETPAPAPVEYGEWTPPVIGRDGYDYNKIHELLAKNTMDAFKNGERNTVGDVLLLGATGYLGSHVLHELIENNDGAIFCFVRPGKEQSGEQRLKATLKYYFGYDYAWLFGSRIRVLEGDATDPEALASFEAPHGGMTAINCAASVKHFAKGNEIDRINVESVKNLCAWCEHNNARLVHISTGSVMGCRENGLPPVSYQFTENILYAGQELDSNQYIHSKFMAERHIYEEIMERGLKATVCRVGNLAPRALDGEFQKNYKTNSYMNSLNAYQTIGLINYDLLNEQTEFSPIDYVAKAVLKLAQTPDDCICFQPLNPHRPLMSDVIRVMNEIGCTVRGAEDEDVNAALNEALADDKKSAAVSSLIAYANNDDIQEIGLESFDNSYTSRVLERLGFEWPETGSDYMRRFLEKLGKKGFFKGEDQ